MNSDAIDRSIAEIEANQPAIVGFGSHKGWTAAKPDFSIIPKVSGFVVLHEKGWDIQNLATQSHIEYLWLAGKTPKVDLRGMLNLKELIIDWNRGVALPGKLSNAYSLSISNWNPELSTAPDCPTLKQLQLIRPFISSVDFLRSFGSIEDLELAYCPKLTDITGIQSLKNLSKLAFLNCKRISSYESIGKHANLSVLRINDCSDVPSLEFLNALERLTEFRCVGTTIRQESLAVLERIPEAAISRKRHHKNIPKHVVS
jgi:Leucine-rich repeat (LRR) protein